MGDQLQQGSQSTGLLYLQDFHMSGSSSSSGRRDDGGSVAGIEGFATKQV